MNDQTGINTEAIRKLCLEIQDYSDKIKNILNQIGDSWEEAKPYFDGAGKNEFNNKFSSLEDSFEVIYQNIASYIDDFNNLTSRYKEFDKELSTRININAENTTWKEE